ncbi:hypothetical protein NG99_21350 [Erwinia typographi]|uniref:Uncharacterized protein n=1 Tax=Erwinia typographi TaxID=371042 RepID=A0A0A3ZRJ0_9GAMM|nr:hypothetical protein [Erwinia typographi]KGT88308.1 hypothetical protein NG99_21350 [Erwinia typographi]
MSHEITLEQAAEMAHQAEIVCAMLEDHPHHMTDGDVSAIAALVKKLAGHAAGWLIEEQAQRENTHA